MYNCGLDVTNLCCFIGFQDGPFIWNKGIQGHVLGSFFYGYLISQIPGGILAEKYGGKWVFGLSLAIATVATLLTPVAAQLSFGLLIFLRVVVGIGSVSDKVLPSREWLGCL